MPKEEGNSESDSQLRIASVPFGIVKESALNSFGGNNLGSFEDLSKDDVRHCSQNNWDYYVSRKQQRVVVFVDEDEIESNFDSFLSEESAAVIDTFDDEGVVSEASLEHHQYDNSSQHERSSGPLSYSSKIESGVSYADNSL